jgi:hypothetical protein
MGALGDLLELAATSQNRWSTFEATVTQYCHAERQRIASERSQSAFVAKRSSPPGEPENMFASKVTERTTTAHLWAKGVDRYRVEVPQDSVADEDRDTAEGIERVSYLAVRNVDESWTREHNGAHSSHSVNAAFGPPDFTGWTSVLDAERLFAGQEVTPDGEGHVDGRPTLRARLKGKGNPSVRFMRPGGMAIFPGWLGDETTVELDNATGVVLALSTMVDGDVMRSFTLTGVRVDEPIEETLFTEKPPAGVILQPLIKQPEPVEIVAAQLSFTVFVPEHKNCAAFVPPRRNDAPVLVTLHVLPEFGRIRAMPPNGIMAPAQLIESASAEAVADPATWNVLELASGPVRIWEPEGGGEVHVRVDRDGTFIWLRGLHDRAELLALADSLVAVVPAVNT